MEANTDFGQYRILRLLGRGGMGEVYEVQHTTLGRSYALKLLPAEFATQPDALARFRREARVMANLNHPHIVLVDDFGETKGRYWLRMELVKGVETWGKAESGKQKAEIARCITLGEYAASQGGQIAPEEFARLLKQMLEAVAYAHEMGVVHRDLKPWNILLEPGASGLVVKVSDFGLARVVGDEFLRSQAQMSMSRSLSIGEAQTLGDEGTSTRALVGTWEYMAPEQRRGEEADMRSDVYAVGLMCYRLLTGKGLGFKLPSELVPGLDTQWDGFVSEAVEQDPAARYANGREMLSAATPLLSLMGSVSELREAEAESQAAVERQRRLAEEEQRAATEAAHKRGQDGRDVQEQLRAERCLRSAERKVKLTAVWRGLGAVLLSPRVVVLLAILAAGVGWWCWKRLHSVSAASLKRPWVNRLGMKFVPVADTSVLFSIWDVRNKDYAAFVASTNGMDGSWQRSGFDDCNEAYPVVNVNWDDAQAFCQWLTDKERREGEINADQSYRLPTDTEWSTAVGLDESRTGTPKDKSGKVLGIYPWGDHWPPPKGAGNFADSSVLGRWRGQMSAIADYADGYSSISPVGSFQPNRFGLHDMGGNVRQWCEDSFDGIGTDRVWRGSSWMESRMNDLLSSSRYGRAPDYRASTVGFRVVLAAKLKAASALPPGQLAISTLTNSLGMKFVPVPGTKALFCVWDVRVKDYEAYAAASAGMDNSWKSPGFEQGPTHPVVQVSWDDAKAFCAWLTKRERQAGLISENQSYRLPTDAEWSVAVGITASTTSAFGVCWWRAPLRRLDIG